MSRLSMFFALLLISGMARAGSLQLTVRAADSQGHVRKHFVYSGCGGDNVSPAISWHGAPTGTRAYALTVFDPDARNGRGWWHWMVIGLPAATQSLAQGAALPSQAFTLRNDFGDASWDGPCPPAGDPPHHYVFTLYALDTTTLNISPGTAPGRALSMLRKHVRAKASVTYTYGR